MTPAKRQHCLEPDLTSGSEVENPQPIRGSTDSPTDPGPRNRPIEKQNPDLYAPPGTDSGSVPNAKWPLGLSHNRHGSVYASGWARQQNTNELPIASAMQVNPEVRMHDLGHLLTSCFRIQGGSGYVLDAECIPRASLAPG